MIKRFSPLFFAGILVACGATPPPKELVDARAAFERAKGGPAATQSPVELHNAQKSLDQAESSFADDGDTPQTIDAAYVARRKAELAESAGRLALSIKEKEAAEKDGERAQTDALRRARGDLQKTKQELQSSKTDLDREKKLREEAEKKAAQAMADLQKIAAVKQEPRGMVITLSGSVLFASGESALLPAAMVKLNEVADALIKGNPDSNMTIEGHTDSQGARDFNMNLSQKRADSVRDYLVSRGIAADRTKAVGIGPDRSIADNKSAEGRANNRRVEIIVGK